MKRGVGFKGRRCSFLRNRVVARLGNICGSRPKNTGFQFCTHYFLFEMIDILETKNC